MRHFKATVALLCALSTYLVASRQAQAQTSNDIGALPFVFIVMDTSGSAEETTKGPGEFPSRDGQSYNQKTITNLGIYNKITHQLTVGGVNDPKSFFGPCAVWEPPTCNDYERPTHYFDDNNNYGPNIQLNQTNGTWKEMSARMSQIYNSPGSYRLSDENQPKHVSMKEILTGDMLLTPKSVVDLDSLNAQQYGPGCWLVPRMSGKSGLDTNEYCKYNGDFRKYADSAAIYPHFQEVYNYQRKNGLLDSLGRSAIFAFSGFDSYTLPTPPYIPSFNDPYPDYSYNPFGRRQAKESDQNCNGTGLPCYNLGVRFFAAPKNLRGLTLTSLASISEYVQQSILDTGYLKKPFTPSPKLSISGSDPNINYQFSPSDTRFLDTLSLGEQPINQSSPFAAAVYDIATYIKDAETNTKYPLNFANDPYANCRDKHVLLISDGAPDPERPDPDINSDVGSASFNPATGIDPRRYPYDSAAQEISFLHQMRNPGGNATQVHIIALLENLKDSLTPAELEDRQKKLRKLDKMAAAGGTCASATLDPSWISTTSNPFECPRNGGKAKNLGKACLDTSDRGNFGGPTKHYTYTIPGTTKQIPCQFPSLVLTQNRRSDLVSAISEIFNNIIQQSGVKSRTRAIYSNDLQSVRTCGVSPHKQTGVNEFLSGMMTSGSPYWAGLLYRNTYACGCNPTLTCSSGGSQPQFTNLSDQINQQVQLKGNPSDFLNFKDNRRIFTTLLSPSYYNYNNVGTGNTYQNLPPREPTRFFRAWLPNISPSMGNPFPQARPNHSLALPTTSIELDKRFLNHLPSIFSGTNQQRTDKIGQFVGLPAMSSEEQVQNVFATLRSRIPERKDRVLGAIYNGNPVAVDPPSLDLPIDSYKAFKKAYANRPPMVFTPTTDGLIHAIYGGEGEVLNDTQTGIKGVIVHRTPRNAYEDIRDSGAATYVIKGNQSQREAWAYFPFTLIPLLANSQGANPYLIDGSPTVKDVRLCSPTPNFNFNEFVCGSGNVAPQDQWRTLLVQGFGLAGKGYVALDVTYGGGRMDPANPERAFAPDPIPLWEFNPTLEKLQIKHLADKGEFDLIGSSLSLCPFSRSRNIDWNTISLMGNSISDPAIGNVLIQSPVNPSQGNIQRSVVLFGGGERDPSAPITCTRGVVDGNLTGRAIYIVDAQTGSILRRFVGYQTKRGEVRFSSSITGSPAFYNGFTGAVATRAFIGDSRGRLYKIDLTDPDPAKWKVYLFFDPTNSGGWIPTHSSRNFGTADYPPAISKLPDGNLMVVYGLGEIGERIDPTKYQLLIALRDRIGISPIDDPDLLPIQQPAAEPTDPQQKAKRDGLWYISFADNEKLTGAPFIFDNEVYYPTFKVNNADDLCDPGEPIINKAFMDTKHGLIVEKTNFEKTKEKTIIRGLALRTNPCCGGDDAPPELVAQTGGSQLSQKSVTQTKGGRTTTVTPDPGSVGTASQSGQLTTFRKRIKNPTSKSVPLAWTRLLH